MATLTSLVQEMQTALTTGVSPLFSTTTCWYAFDPESQLKNPPGDKFAVIQPTGFKVLQRAWKNGAGAIGYVSTWTATIWLFVRLATDEAHREDNYLLDATNGSLTLADSVIDLFQTYKVVDGTNLYGYELEEVVWPSKDRPSSGWATTQLKYKTDVTGR